MMFLSKVNDFCTCQFLALNIIETNATLGKESVKYREEKMKFMNSWMKDTEGIDEV